MQDEAELRFAAEQFEAAQALARIGIWSIDLTTNEVSFSNELRRILGVAPEDSLMELLPAIDRFISAEDQAMAVETLVAALSTAEPFTIEVGLKRDGEDDGILNVFGTSTRDAEGNPTRIWGTAQDVTDHRRAERQLASASTALERERETVDQLEQAFRPRLPVVDGVDIAGTYRPAGTEAVIGGDWYHAGLLPNGNLSIMIGDVAGHGITAAGLMVQLRMGARALTSQGFGPGATLAAINDLAQQSDAQGLASAIIAELDPRSGLLTWSVAGHPPLIVHRPGRGLETGGGPDGPPVGTMPGITYTERTTTIDPGDLIVLYTDGLVERRGEALSDGFARLHAVVEALAGPGDLEPFCVEVCDRTLADVPSSDDLCLLAIRRTVV